MIPLRPILDYAPDNYPDAPEDGSALPTWEDDRDYLADHWKDRYYEGLEMTEAEMIDIDHLERRIKYRDDGEPLLPPSPDEVLALIAEIRRLQGILSDYNGTTKEQLMARVDKLERENRALGRMIGNINREVSLNVVLGPTDRV